MEPTPWRHLLMVAISVAGAAAIMWMEMPPDHRSMMVLTMRSRCHRALHSAARRAGRLGMSSELRGYGESAAAGYGLAYQLSRLRDRI